MRLGTLSLFDSLRKHGTLIRYDSLQAFGTLIANGSLATLGNLTINGSLFHVGTLARDGSLFHVVTLIAIGSLLGYDTYQAARLFFRGLNSRTAASSNPGTISACGISIMCTCPRCSMTNGLGACTPK